GRADPHRSLNSGIPAAAGIVRLRRFGGKCARRASFAANPHLHSQLHMKALTMADFYDDLSTPTEDDLNSCYGSKYLSAADLGDKRIRTRISKIRKEVMQQQGGTAEVRALLHH